MPRGRPKKLDTDGTPEQVEKRLYQRKYMTEVKRGIVELEKAEKHCLEELDKIRKERTKMIDILEASNNQASAILREKVGTDGVKKVPPKPKTFKYTDDDWYSMYLRKDAGTQLSAVAKRAIAKKTI